MAIVASRKVRLDPEWGLAWTTARLTDIICPRWVARRWHMRGVKRMQIEVHDRPASQRWPIALSRVGGAVRVCDIATGQWWQEGHDSAGRIMYTACEKILRKLKPGRYYVQVVILEESK